MKKPDDDLRIDLGNIARELCKKHLKPAIIQPSRYYVSCSIDKCELQNDKAQIFCEDFLTELQTKMQTYSIIKQEKEIKFDSHLEKIDDPNDDFKIPEENISTKETEENKYPIIDAQKKDSVILKCSFCSLKTDNLTICKYCGDSFCRDHITPKTPHDFLRTAGGHSCKPFNEYQKSPTLEKIISGNEEKIPERDIETKNNHIKLSQKSKKLISIFIVFVLILTIGLFLIVDLDRDSLNNITELQHGTSLFNSDSDYDNLIDGDEVYLYHTDPLASDSDKDGLDDYAELRTYFTNPLTIDFDNDNLNDGDEIRVKADPHNPDTDGDGYQDGSDSHPIIHEWKLIDSDNDGWDDYKEYYEKNTDRFKSDTDDDGQRDSIDPHPTVHEWKLIDSDNDGWNDYKESYETGTDRFDSDTDGDGAPDSLDANPLNSAHLINRDFYWDFPSDWWNQKSWSWSIQVSQDLYIYESQLPRITSWYEWDQYTEDPVLESLAPGLKEAAENEEYDYYDTVNYVLAFVQSLPYTVDDITAGANEYPRYPIETLVDGGGDCEDTSFLAAGLLKIMNYDVCLLQLPEHMAIGVVGGNDYPGSYFNSTGKHYYYCETTGTGWLMGDIPPDFAGQLATIIPIS